MAKQRSKAELLRYMRTAAAFRKDAEEKESISGKVVYWRMGVEWCAALWKDEKFSTNELQKFTQYIADNDVTNMTEERRAEITELLRTKKLSGNLETESHKKGNTKIR